jgi:uncharacterized sulfatase
MSERGGRQPPADAAAATADAADSDGVLLITVDSLRADALDPAVTPTLSALAESATTFERAFAHGHWTPFAFPSLLGSAPVFADSAEIGLADSPTLAETLSAAGVTTAGFNAANGFLTEHWGYDRGFDRFESFIDASGWLSGFLAAHPTVHGWAQLAASPLRRVTDAVGRGEESPFVDVSHCWDVEQRARAFIEAAEPPFFCWVHYMDAHTPYVPAPQHLQAVDEAGGLLDRLRAHLHAGLGWSVDEDTLAALRSLYLGGVNQVDASVGRLLSTLETEGLRDSTTVVVTGDHGEEFQDHGHLAHYPKLYDELVRVPLVVDHPGDAGHVTAPVGHERLPPTVCTALGVDPEPFDADSLLPVVRGATTPGPAPVTAVAVRGDSVTQQPIPQGLADGETLVSARTERFTYIYHADSGRRELYDRTEDPDEQRDQFETGDAPEWAVDPLHEAVEARLAAIGPDGGDANDEDGPGVSAAVDRRLEALGYR